METPGKQHHVQPQETGILTVLFRPRGQSITNYIRQPQRRLIYNPHPHNNTLAYAERTRLPKTRLWLLPAPAVPAEVARMEGSEPAAAAVPGPQLVLARAES